MGPVVGLLAVMFVVLVVVEANVELLKATELAEPVARFQTWSLLTGAGYSTRESELVVAHPLRRRTALLVMLTGALGLMGLLAGVIGSFVNAPGWRDVITRLLIVVSVVVAEGYLVRSRAARRLFRVVVERRMRRWARRGVTSIPLVTLGGEQAVVATAVTPGSDLIGRTVGELREAAPRLTVLGLRRDDARYVPAPTVDLTLQAGDVLVVHGPEEELAWFAESGSGGE